MADTDEILLGREGGLATLTINRPQALNALTLDNYRRIDPALRDWAADPSVHAVVVRGAGDRAFCAGGDVRAVYEAGRGISGDPDLPAVFFREEYELIRRIHHFPKPYLAIIDGITMGGGAGISVNGAYRIATERTLFAMPETGIGLFPDVGATRFLNRCPGHVGRYLGLTGARLNAADALYCGFATHAVKRDSVEALLDELSRERQRAVEDCLRRFAVDPGPAPLAALQPAIDRCFARDSVEAILDALAAEAAGGGADAEWADGNARRPADQIADQPQDHLAPADDRAGLRPRRGARPRIPADPARHGRARFLRRRAGDADRQGPEAAMAPGDSRRGYRQHGRRVFRADRRSRAAVRLSNDIVIASDASTPSRRSRTSSTGGIWRSRCASRSDGCRVRSRG